MESNCLIIAGEKSGEEHCLSFFKAVSKACPETKFWGVGGEELKKQGMDLIYDLKEFSSWGFSEVIGKIPFYFNALTQIEEMVVAKNCKVAILIDFQDFNLRLAKRLKKGVLMFFTMSLLKHGFGRPPGPRFLKKPSILFLQFYHLKKGGLKKED